MTAHKMPGEDLSPSITKRLELLKLESKDLDEREIVNTPIFTEHVWKHIDGATEKSHRVFSQYGLLGGDVSKLQKIKDGNGVLSVEDDPFVHYNVTAPSSTFICGSQGSGKSHTLSCLLENCLLRSDANTLPQPLTGIVFHFDPFASEANGQPCEAAYLSSHPDVSVRVLCAPTNVRNIKSTYADLPNVKVEELRLSQSDLNTKRMLDLMAVSSIQGGAMPLYFHVVTRILKEMRIQQQQVGGFFDYGTFKRAIEAEGLIEGQLGPLRQRLESLESFMAQEHVVAGLAPKGLPARKNKSPAKGPQNTATKWEGKPGQLTIVDLSCPCVTAEAACSLFNICLSLFLEQSAQTGRVVALDEAHKYMTESAESLTLTESLLSTIRLQRHLGARVIIATQEPTISPKLLDLCSVSIVHRFTSPDWLATLKRHLAAATSSLISSASSSADRDKADKLAELFARIVALRQGEALLFCPSALVGVEKSISKNGSDPDPWADWWKGPKGDKVSEKSPGRLVDSSGNKIVRLECGVMHIRVRERVTEDGGKSIMAV